MSCLRYDAHFIVRELGMDVEEDEDEDEGVERPRNPGEEDEDDDGIVVIASSEEKFITFSKKVKGLRMRFVDTFRFLSCGLDQLAKNLPRDRFEHVTEHFHDQPLQTMELLMQKGVFCYDYVDNVDRLDENQLPTKEKFFSKLYNEGITDAQYELAQRVWEAMGCTTLGEYCDVYLLVDVLILADVFENFRKTSLEDHKLDPAWYITAPGLTWDAMLRMSRVALHLVEDKEMLYMIEHGVRGGVAQVIKRYSENAPGTRVMYLDANNLYGWAMKQYLPVGNFDMIETPEGIEALGPLENIPDEGHYGYFFEVDVHYPPELHDLHRDLPFLCEKMCPPGGQTKKLLTTLLDKERYVVHYRLLKQAVVYGLVVTRIRRVIRFEQRPWMQSFVEFNTSKRMRATNNADRDRHKLMNNAAFGKTLESKRDRICLDLVKNPEKLAKLISSPRFKDRTILTEDLVCVHRSFNEVLMDKPIYVGLAVLDLSKLLMYQFHYDKMMNWFGPERLLLCYMDTDSFIYEIRSNNLDDELYEHREEFDFGNYPADHKLHDMRNDKVLGKMKDEVGGKTITRFVGLRPKAYALEVEGSVHKRAKGVKKSALKHQITFEHYLQCLMERRTVMASFNRITSKEHVIITVEQHKLALSPFDDKRHVLEDGVHTLPYGHYSLME